jgi:hypothetical protein
MRRLHELGAEACAEALAEHRRVIREACTAERRSQVDTQGDAFFFAFPTAPGALSAAEAFTEALASGPIRVRVGLHTGTPLLTDEGRWLRIMYALRNMLGVADYLERIADVSLARGDRERAERLPGAAATLRREAGDTGGPDESL